MNRKKAIPTPRHRLAAAIPYQITGDTPENVLYLPAKLSMWGNNVFGDCVTAEEAAAKAMNDPEIFIPMEVVEIWAALHGTLNGADIEAVMTSMETLGFIVGATLYNDGPHVAVDWTNAAILQNAIAQGPVKIGVAAAQLQNAVTAGTNGWLATGFKADSQEDHCVNLCGFGTIAWLAEKLGGTLPAGVDGTQPGYALFTWDSIGIIDVPSLLAICGEAWLRQPTTVIKSL